MTDYPDNPGFYPHAPETSREAAEHVADAAMARELAALHWLRSRAAYGGTADEVADGLGWEERYSARPRLSMLRARGQILDSGKRRKGISGRMQAVWVLPQFMIHDGENAHVG